MSTFLCIVVFGLLAVEAGVLERRLHRRARERVLAALIEHGGEVSGAELKKRGVVGEVYCYTVLIELEEAGLVQSRLDTDQPLSEVEVRGSRRRLYRAVPRNLSREVPDDR